MKNLLTDYPSDWGNTGILSRIMKTYLVLLKHYASLGQFSERFPASLVHDVSSNLKTPALLPLSLLHPQPPTGCIEWAAKVLKRWGLTGGPTVSRTNQQNISTCEMTFVSLKHQLIHMRAVRIPNLREVEK